MTKKPSILFMGTPEFARVSLEALWNDHYPILGVVSQPDRPAGRGQKKTSPACALFSRQKNLPLFQPENLKLEEPDKIIRQLKPDFIVVAAYGLFLPQKIIDAPTMATLNVHASLLPKYRGAAPINWVLIHGEGETGVSLMKIAPKMDSGAVYAQVRCFIEPTDNSETLSLKLGKIAARLLLQTLPQIYDGTITPVEQDESFATFAPALKKEDGKIEWNQEANKIHDLIRGLIPWPGAHTFIDNKNLKIYDSFVAPEVTGKEAGIIYLISPKGIHVACHDSSLCLTTVQLEGKKKMAAADFARGYRLKEGQKLT